MPDSQIYLSVVVTARNDDHGGSLLSRMQAFVNGWIGQCRRHALSAELIVVDWNPPEDRPPLIEAVRWPPDTHPCQVRFIQVPPEIHRKFRHAEHLPLYQMIAKNVGIRRARGRFILVTNIDILFSDELVGFLAMRQLEPGRMYRIDRHDVMSDVPVNGSVDEQLTYCRTHLIRLNAREGTFALTPEGLRASSEHDIASTDSGISLGCGWYAPERNSPQEVFRWVADDAEVVVKVPPGCPALALDLEPGPGVKRQPFLLQVLNANSAVVAHIWIRGRCIVELQLPSTPGATERFFLRAVGGGMPIAEDPRLLNFRVYRCAWSDVPVRPKQPSQASLDVAIPSMPSTSGKAEPAPEPNLVEGTARREGEYILSSKPLSVPVKAMGLWKKLRRTMRESGQGDPDTPMAVTVPTPIRRALHAYYTDRGVSGVFRWALHRYFRPRRLVSAVPAGQDIFDSAANILPGRGWYDLEHFHEETFRWAQNDAELIVRRPKGNSVRLAMHIEPGPGVGWKPFELQVREDGSTIARTKVEKLRYLEIPLSLEPDKTHILSLHLEGGDLPCGSDPRHLNFRFFWCGWSGGLSTSPVLPSSSPLPDIPRENGLTLGAGWQPVMDEDSGEACFGASGNAEILVRSDEALPRTLRLELAPEGEGPHSLVVRDSSARAVAQGTLHGRQICYVTLPIIPGPTQKFTLSLAHNQLRIYRLGWTNPAADITDFASGLRTRTGWSPLTCATGEIFRIVQESAELEITVPGGPQRYLILDLESTTSEVVSCSLLDEAATTLGRFSVGPRKTVYAEVPWQPGTRVRFRLAAPQVRVYRCAWSACPGEPESNARHFSSEGVMAESSQDMVGSGLDLGGAWYPAECSQGQIFRWASNQAEVFIRENRPRQSLLIELEAGPSLKDDSFVLQVLDRSWRRVAEFPVLGRQELQVELPQQAGWPNVYRLVVEGGGLPVANDPRILDFRVFRIELEQPEADHPATPKWAARVVGQRGRGHGTMSAITAHKAEPAGAVHLHTNACGDFTLMAREHWFDLRGYPEFDMYSFHIDSILCYAAHHGGAREEILKEPMRVYHIEHGLGSGWTPEGQAKLFDRLRAQGILWIEYQELVLWAAQMRKLNSPLIFNRESWGLAEFDLPEMVLRG